MLKKRQLYPAVLAAVLIGGGGAALAGKMNDTENDALGVTRVPVSLLQAVAAAEQSANGKAARAEFEQDKSGPHYEVEIVSGAKVYDVRIDAASGKVLSSVEDHGDQQEKDDDKH